MVLRVYTLGSPHLDKWDSLEFLVFKKIKYKIDLYLYSVKIYATTRESGHAAQVLHDDFKYSK